MGVVTTTAIGGEVAAAPPHPLSSAEKTARYRARHPDRVVAQRKSPSGVRCQKEAHKRYRDRHPEKRKKQWRDWAARNPTKRALAEERRFAKKYGVTRVQRDAVLAAQGSCCAICQSTTARGRNWATDHDHKTGEFRGVLCNPCNTALGLFRDNPATLRKAVSYLEHSHGCDRSHDGK